MTEWKSLSTHGRRRGPARTVVVQPLPGLGDMIQLIPALKGLARGDENGGVDLITLENFPTEAVFAGTDYVFRHAGAILRHGYASAALTKGDQGGGRTGGDGGGGGSGKARRNVVRENVRRALVLFDMARLMRSGRYKRAVILGASWRYAAAARLAGIEDVAGYGSRLQTLFLNDGLIPDGRSIRHLHAQRLGCAAILLDRLGLALEGAPELVLPPEAAALAAAPYAHLPRPWTAVAVGSADPNRVWPADRMAAVLDRLHGAGRTTQFIVATQAEAPLVQGVIRACRTARPLPLIGQPLREVMGLLAACDMAFCTDSGIMNVAASLGVPTHALFGTVQPYAYWSCLHPIVSRAGVRPDVGVSVIDLDEVLGHFVTQGILPG